MTISATQSMNSIDRFLQEVAATEKTAAEAHTEPGSVGGSTDHPVKDVDDFTEEAKEGFRSAENDADVKADQGPPSVDNTPEGVADKKAAAVDGKSESGNINPPGTAAEDQIQIGTKKEPTGQDPSVETSSVKAEKEDPASAPAGQMGHSSSPARTNNSELDGFKYAELNIEQHAKVASDLGNQLLAGIANSGSLKAADCGEDHEEKGEDEGEDEGVDEKDETFLAKIKESSDVAGQAGWELAGLLSGNFDKAAADSLVKNTLGDIISTADADAEKVAEYVLAYESELQKQAMGEMPQGVDPAALLGEEEAAMGLPPEAAVEEAEMAGAMAGGDPGAGEGGADIEQLAALLEQLGISPEEFEAAMAAQAGGEMGGEELPPIGGEGPIPEEAALEEDVASAPPGMEVEASAKTAAAKKGSASKSTRDYIQEVLERSRR
jgi:hypothetical protein